MGNINDVINFGKGASLLENNSTGAIFYVDPDEGNDENDGLTTTTAFRTLQCAINHCPHFRFRTPLGRNKISTIRFKGNAINHYSFISCDYRMISFYAWDFTNDVSMESTGTLNLTAPTDIGVPNIYSLFSFIYIYCATVNIVNTRSLGIQLFESSIEFGTSSMNYQSLISIDTSESTAIGIEITRNSYCMFRGRQTEQSKLTIRSGGNGINCTQNSFLQALGSIDIESGLYGGNTYMCLNVYANSTVNLSPTGATASNICTQRFISKATGAAINVQSGSYLQSNSNYTNFLIENTSTATATMINVGLGASCALRSYTSGIINNKSGVTTICAYQCANLILIIGTSGTQTISSASTINSTIYADTGGKIVIQGGSANTFPVVTGLTGLNASNGGTIAYSNIKNNATTKTSTSSGGRIYSGNQSSIPNY